MPYLKSDAIVLRCRPFSRTSQIVSALTRDYGRRAFLAKGSRRPATASNPFDGPLDSLYMGEAVFIQRPASGLDLMTAFALTDAHRGTHRRMARFQTAMVLCELTEKATAEGDLCPELFDALTASAMRLCSASDGEASGLRAAYALAILRTLGRDPQLNRCVACALPRPPQRAGIVDLEAGGIVCRRCRGGGGKCMMLKGPTLQWLNKLRDGEVISLDSTPPAPIIARDASRFLQAAIEYILGRRLFAWEHLST